jgi:hypothetical protein
VHRVVCSYMILLVLDHVRRRECGTATAHHCTHVPNVLVPQGGQYRCFRPMMDD